MTRPITHHTGAAAYEDMRPVFPVKSRVEHALYGVGKVVFWSPVNRLTYVEYPDAPAVFICSPSAQLTPTTRRVSAPAATAHNDLFGPIMTRQETAEALRVEASRLYNAAANLADTEKSAFETEARADMLHIVADWFEAHNDLFGPL